MTEIIHSELSYRTIGAAMEVHRVLGAGFLEAVYEQALAEEFELRNIPYERQVSLPVYYKGNVVGENRADLVVDGKIIVEIKATPNLILVYEAQAIHWQQLA